VLPSEPSELDRSTEVADRDELERALRRVSQGQRSILVLTYYLGFTLGDVAVALDIPVGTAKSRLHYAIEALRAALAADSRASDTRAQPPAARGGRTA
jgi:RNA polymerase sigma-70 factor (ECF subfamily)